MKPGNLPQLCLIVRLTIVLAASTVGACVPRIELAMPKEPITINMNVKIEHEITIKADPQSAALLQPTICQATQRCPAGQ
ncbi:YnbE family lipoprotein [Acerihabitans sp. TG2]|uniref:YnbE family lipoprotein n=1 Tax=Acerihabitans sp. TG2 TaxID=3096008 RepID=UPI002B23300C|nr:YnbE family lipoprotein [Acerihabitans sp. TG2]MEA9389369.1 YnbE family lipoprotein [Acerihabitans sp. TG2]